MSKEEQYVLFFCLAVLSISIPIVYATQEPSGSSDTADEGNPLLDMASTIIQAAINNQINGGQNEESGGKASVGPNLSGVVSLIGSLIQSNSGSGGKGGINPMQIISGIGSLLSNSGSRSGDNDSGGFDIGHILDMFVANTADNDDTEKPSNNGKQSQKGTSDSGINLAPILHMASTFMSAYANSNSDSNQQNHHHPQKRSLDEATSNLSHDEPEENSLINLLPMAMQAISSFAGPEGQKTQEKHKSHAWVLPPFLEHIHVLWDHFSNSDLADALYHKSGVNLIFKGFKGRDGKLDYDKFFESLNNQSFRRRWIKAATLYLADWANYLANPDVHLRYFQTAQLMFNGFLKSQGYPKKTFFDPSRPSETISNLFDYIAKHHLDVQIDSKSYVKPAVGYANDLLKLGKARGLLQKFNAEEMSDKLTDTLNLEVIEPILKVHRAYQFITKTPHCDRYVLCELNSYDENGVINSKGLISGVSPKIVKVGSIGAAIFLSTETGTPFWTLFSVINSPHQCESKYPVDCTGFHEGEAKVTTEYIHNEL